MIIFLLRPSSDWNQSYASAILLLHDVVSELAEDS